MKATIIRSWLFIVVGLCAPVAANAQSTTPAPSTQTPGLLAGLRTFGEGVYQTFFSKAVHLTFGSVAPGGGFTFGVGAKPEAWKQHRLGLEVQGSASLKKYWLAKGDIWWQQSNTFRIEGYGRVRKMTRLDFYGLGPSSLENSRTDFAMLERITGATGWYRPACQFAIGGRSEGLWPEVKSGMSNTVSSLETRFGDADASGFSEQPSFIHLQGFANVNYPCGEFERPRRGGDFQVTYNRYTSFGTAAASFQSFEVEGQHRLTLLGRDRTLTLHGWFSAARPDANNYMPFYLMPTLGGAHNLTGFREALIGGDQTAATLRGFSDFRFRDRNLLLAQVEYRIHRQGPFEFTIFADAGSVAPQIDALSLGKRDVGFSISFMRVNATIIRVDVGFAGGEGVHHFVAPGSVIAP